MAENGKSAWTDPRLWVPVIVIVAGGLTSWAVFGERLEQARRDIDKHELRLTDVEKKIPGLDVIDAKLTNIDKNLNKLADRVEEIARSR